jgi:WD40 repeat protein
MHTRAGAFEVWSINDGKLRRVTHKDKIEGAPFKLVISADSRRAALAAGVGGVSIRSIPDMEEIKKLTDNTAGPIIDAALSGDGALALTLAQDHTVKLWDVEPGTVRFALPRLETDNWKCLAISTDGSRLLVSGVGGVLLSDTANGREILRLTNKQPACAVFSPDDKQVLVADIAGQVAIVDASIGSRLGPLVGYNSAPDLLAFAPSGNRALTVNADAIRVWSIPERRQLAELRHSDRPVSASFSPDGKRVISVSLAGTAWLWNVERGQRVGSFALGGGPEYDARFLPSGDHVMLRYQGIVRLWPHLRSQEIVSMGCNALVRPLSRAQRRDFFLDEAPKDPPCGWHPE